MFAHVTGILGAAAAAAGQIVVGYTPTAVTDGLSEAKKLGSTALEVVQTKLTEAADHARQLSLRKFKQSIQNKKFVEIEEALNWDPLLPIKEIPDCNFMEEIGYSFLAFAATLADDKEKKSFNAMIDHDRSMIACLIDDDTNDQDIERIVAHRPELLLRIIQIDIEGTSTRTHVFNYLMRKGNRGSSHLNAALCGYKKTKITLKTKEKRQIQEIFTKYFTLATEKPHEELLRILTPHKSYFSDSPPRERSVSSGLPSLHSISSSPSYSQPVTTPERLPSTSTTQPQSSQSRSQEPQWDGLGEFQRTVSAWYIALRPRVWFHKGNKLEKIQKPPSTLYQAAQLINTDTVNNNSSNEQHILATELSEHRRWSWYSWLGKQFDFKRSLSTCQEIVSLLATMPKYKDLNHHELKARDDVATSISPALSDKEKELHAFQQAVCLNYLKKRGTVWFSNGDKAKLIAIAQPHILSKAAKLIQSKATESQESKTGGQQPAIDDKEAHALAEKLSQHRRWPWFSWQRGHSTCAESLLEVAKNPEYKSLIEPQRGS